VIVSLVYLAAQIRQNSQVVRTATRQAVSTSQMEIGMQLASNPELRAAAARWAGRGEAPSSPDEQLRDDFLLRAILRTFENQYHQNQDGTFEDVIWAGYVENMRRVFVARAFLSWWQHNRSLYSAEFADFVDRVVSADQSRRDPARVTLPE
jgi:hypothetical protein